MKKIKLLSKISILYFLVFILLLASCTALPTANNFKVQNALPTIPPTPNVGEPPCSKRITSSKIMIDLSKNETTEILISRIGPPFMDPSLLNVNLAIQGVNFSRYIEVDNLQIICYGKTFTWDGKDNNGNYVEDGLYHFKLYDKDFIFLGSTSVRVISGSLNENTEFIESGEIKELGNKLSTLNVPEDIAKQLSKAASDIEALTAKKLSLEERIEAFGPNHTPPPEVSSKLLEITSQLGTLDTKLAQLISSITGSVNSLYSSAGIIANHVNTVTGTNYIEPYPIEEKPDGVGGYFDSSYFADIDITIQLQDGVTLYAPDEDDPDQENLKNVWEVDSERVEILDPSQVFDASKGLYHEIQTAKDLVSDYNSFPNEDKAEAIKVLADLIIQISTHKSLLQLKVNKLSEQYSTNFEKLKVAEAELFQSFILPLALAMEQSGEYDDDTWIRKVTSMNTQSFRIMTEPGWVEYMLTKYFLVLQLKHSSLPEQEKVVAIVLKYSLAEWNALKSADPEGLQQLVDATFALIEAVGIPTTTTGLALSVSGHLGKALIALSKLSSKLLVKSSATLTPAQKLEITKLQAGIAKAKESLFKWLGKVPTITCPFTTQGFQTKANFKALCELFDNVVFDEFMWKIKGTVLSYGNMPLKHNFDNFYRSLNAVRKEVKTLPSTDIRRKAIDLLDTFKTNGVLVKNSSLPDLSPYTLHSVNVGDILKGLGKTSGYVRGNVGVDFKYADLNLAPILKSQGIINYTTEKEAINAMHKFRSKYGVTWHHLEDLKTMQLVPKAIHANVDHSGAVSFLSRLGNNQPELNKLLDWLGYPGSKI